MLILSNWVVNNLNNSLDTWNDKLTEIGYKVLRKTKNRVQEEKIFTSKNGFSNFRFNIICGRIQRKLKDGYDFLMELAQAQINKG